MNVKFEKMDPKHQSAVMRIFNHYSETGTAAFASKALPEPYSPFPTFAQTTDITYFIAPEFTGMGIGSECLSNWRKTQEKWELLI